MPKTRRKYKGNATATTVSAGLSAGATSCVIGSATGWPTSGPFYVVVDPGLSTEEKVLVGSISGTTISSLTRGVDDTTDQNHAAGCSIYPVFTAVDADEANELTSTYANQGGIVYQGASTFAQLAIGTAGHVMKVNSGATAPEWGQVATAGIADSAVTSAKIADGTIVLADLAAALQAFLVPVGTIAMYGGASAPTGWLLCDGTSTTGYTALAAIVGANTPDLRGRFAIGDNASLTLLGTGGSATIAEANLPSHTHTFSATSGSSTTGITLSTTGAHVHTINGEGFVANVQDVLNGDGQRVLESDLSTSASTEDTASAGDHTHTVTDSGHTHSVSGTTGNGSGSGTAYYQPYLVVNYIIKHD
jgi:microcystin-dependent protein